MEVQAIDLDHYKVVDNGQEYEVNHKGDGTWGVKPMETDFQQTVAVIDVCGAVRDETLAAQME